MGPPGKGTRDRILEAALACFSEHGVVTTPLEAIRDRAGVSVGSLYHFFAGKEAIVSALLVDGFRQYQASRLAALAAATSGEGAIAACVRAFLQWITEHPTLARLILHTRPGDLGADVRAAFRAMNRDFYEAATSTIGSYRASAAPPALSWELFTAIVTGPSHEFARLWLGGATTVRQAEVEPVLARATWQGLLAAWPPPTPPARKDERKTPKKKAPGGPPRPRTKHRP